MQSSDQRHDRVDLATLLGADVYQRFLNNKTVAWANGDLTDEPSLGSGLDAIVSYRQLQDRADYRTYFQRLFAQLRIGGVLAIVVPHAFLFNRQLALPSSAHSRQRRLYTPASLAGEVEEALAPNDYRIHWIGDLDHGVDYSDDLVDSAATAGDVGLILERIAPPAWPVVTDPADRPSLAAALAVEKGLMAPLMAGPEFAFEPRHTRIETATCIPVRRILVLKLDHIGDFLMSLSALERLRGHFPDAAIDLVVGSWNVDMARVLGVADHVVGFDAFPRNSSEEEPNVEATVGQFRALFTASYDLAIDLRVDIDTRTLLRAANATLKAAIGTRARFPFLGINLPLDHTRNDAETVRNDRITHNTFVIQGSGARRHFALRSNKSNVERDCAIVWGPFLKLVPGDYLFDFYIDLEEARGEGMLRLDIALDGGTVASEMFVTGPADFHLPFRIERPDTVFEARIWAVEGQPSISFDFYGGRLVKRAPADVLHQSEYPQLLVELVALRLNRRGLLASVAMA